MPPTVTLRCRRNISPSPNRVIGRLAFQKDSYSSGLRQLGNERPQLASSGAGQAVVKSDVHLEILAERGLGQRAYLLHLCLGKRSRHDKLEFDTIQAALHKLEFPDRKNAGKAVMIQMYAAV